VQGLVFWLPSPRLMLMATMLYALRLVIAQLMAVVMLLK
jgi:hypothetical protein